MLKPKQFLIVGIVAALGATMGIAYVTASVLAQGAPAPVQVTIVPGASTMMGAAGAKAFSPNPVSVKVGQNVTWTNKDTVLPGHTVISGTGGSDPNKGKVFDSGLTTLILTGKSFSHKFTTAGEVPYFCQIHPNMVGKIEVTA